MTEDTCISTDLLMQSWQNSHGEEAVREQRRRERTEHTVYRRNAGEMRQFLESQFPENVYIHDNQLADFDFTYADEWCHVRLRGPRWQIGPFSTGNSMRAQLVAERIVWNGRWCYFVNTYYFANREDAMLFRLSTT